jgi:hypothetical protein
MNLAILDGPVVWVILGLICFGSVIGLIVFLAVSLSNKKSVGAPSLHMPVAPGSRIFQFSRNGTPIGQFPEGAVIQLITNGQILLDDDCWTQGMTSWQKVSSQPNWGGVGK